MDLDTCNHCGNSISPEREHCPHCAKPVPFPNVRAAMREQQALTERYDAAMFSAATRGCAQRVVAFEGKLAGSRAVLNRPLPEAERLASSDKQLYATFYGLLEAEVRLPYGDKWDRLRRIADEALFPGYKERIRFAALTLDDRGLFRFGECSLILREKMIAHRASVFEENSTLFLKRCNYDPRPGFRALWSDRAKLCVAKLADKVHSSFPEDEFATLLLYQASRPERDHFVEVHIWGPLSVHSIEQITVRANNAHSPATLAALRENLQRAGVEMEVR
jgi:hypothetical protein